MKLLVIGGGNMGLTYSEGMANSSLLTRHKLRIYDKSPELVVSLSKIEHFDVYGNIEECLPDADIIFLAVKPYHVEQLFKEIRPLVNNDQIFVSIMAGVTIRKIQDGLGITKVVRAMPNLPAQVGKGVTSYTGAKEVSRVELLMIRNLLDTTGESIHVETENYIDASTGISGSGPAYVFILCSQCLRPPLKWAFLKTIPKSL